MIQIARIEAERLRRGHYRFVLRASPGEFIAASAPFNALEKGGEPLRGTTEQTELELLVNMLRRDGWEVVQQPTSPWYCVRLARGTDDEVGALKRELFLRGETTSMPDPKRGGLSVQAMWAITLIVVIGLFGLCVLLAFTAELRISPAG